MTPGAGAARLWEVDVLRTAAIVMMVVYHVVYDVELLAPGAGPDPFEGVWDVLQVACASTFLGVVGISFWIRDRRLVLRGVGRWERWRSGLPRGLQVLGAALLVSAATYVAVGDELVRFGILHLIVVAQLVVLPPLVGLKALNAVLGVAAIAGGLAIDGAETTFAPLLVLGLDPGEAGVDWVPLLPWIGVPLLGAALGALAYPDGRRHPRLRALGDGSPRLVALGAPGRRSLTIYLVHQPVLIAVIAGVLLLLGESVDGL